MTQREMSFELSFVKTLVELHGGRFQLVSKPKEEMKISCFFPCNPNQNQPHKDEINSEVSASN